jgi:photosystem II stability/assembly factor-like uncharacterized protein
MEPQGNPDVGSVAALLPDPGNANILYAGTTNGGIWKTTNATATVPTWTPLTDHLPTLAIGALAFSPLDRTGNTLFAATGNFGSGSWGDGSFWAGGDPAGILESTNGGKTWTVLGQSTFAGQNLRQILPTSLTTKRGQVILASAGGSLAQEPGTGGVWRSSDGGRTWTALSGAGKPLPAGDDQTLIEDPDNANVLYTAVIGQGVYRSSDGGQTWSAIDGSGSNAIPTTILTYSINLKLAINSSGTLFLLTSTPSMQGFGISDVFYSTDQGKDWTLMDVLSDSVGRPINSDGFGNFELGIAVDPNPKLSTVVYVTGSAAQSAPSLPEEGIVYRGDYTQPLLSQWAVVVGPGATGTPPGGSGNHPTIPHSDSKALTFDAAGNLLLGDDGGVYKLVNPDGAAANDRYWVSVNGTLQNTEFYSVAYDSIDHVVIGGSQDNGMAIQPQPGQAAWNQGFYDDVTGVAVDNSGPTAIVYGMGIDFYFWRGDFSTQANNLTQVRLANKPGGALYSGLSKIDYNSRGYIPFALNAVNPQQLMLGLNDLYESADQGDVIAKRKLPDQDGVVSAIVYGGFSGGTPKATLAYVGTYSGQLYLRTTAGDTFCQLTTPFNGKGPILSITLDPNDWRTAYVVVNNTANNSQVWRTTDAGTSWTNVTGDLDSHLTKVASVALIHPTATTTMLVAGGLGHGTGGVFATTGPIGSSTHWRLLGSGLPNADVQQVVYNAAARVLVAAPFGRGAWTLTNFIAPTETKADNAIARFRPRAQVVTLTAAVTSTAGPVNEGTVTFTVRHGGAVVGSPVTSGTVSNGLASVSYTLPAGTAAGTYTIDVVYNPGADFLGSSDSTHTLTVRRRRRRWWSAPTTLPAPPGTHRGSNSAGAPGFIAFAYGFGSIPVVGSWRGSGTAEAPVQG